MCKLSAGNIVLLICLLLSWTFTLLSAVVMYRTLRHGVKELGACFSGTACCFSFIGILTWYIFALAEAPFGATMTVGVWFMLLTSFAQLISYIFKRHYVSKFNKSAIYRQILANENNDDDQVAP